MRPKKIALLLPVLYLLAVGAASSRFTEKQFQALRKYVGKSYWVGAERDKRPLFLSAPAPSATPFIPEPKAPFQITELLEGSEQKPYNYYKVRFEAGKEGYIGVDSFLEQLNLTLLTVDPDEGQKIRSAKEAEEKSKREARIRAQPWSEQVKEAVLQRKAILGMRMQEVREALGKPTSVVKVKNVNPLLGQLEQWIYDNGPVLTFTNGLVSSIQPAEKKTE